MLTLKEARESRGVKLQAVAEAIGVTRQTYSKYEQDPRNMPIEKAVAACNFLHYKISEIFFG